MFSDVDEEVFFANLYVDGLPVVLNQQRLKARLRDERITQRERLDVEVELASEDGRGYLTLADHEDDRALLLKFKQTGGNIYSISCVLKGEHNGDFLDISPEARHVVVRKGIPGAGFSIAKFNVERAGPKALSQGPSYIQMRSEANQKGLYLARTEGKVNFRNVDPNVTRHDAYNNEPVTFVLKIIDRTRAAQM